MILLDTCVLSEVARPAPDPRVLAWFDGLADEDLRISALSIGEIQRGVELLEPGARRQRVEAWLEGLVTTFADRILGIDEAVARRWGTLGARAQRAGRPRPPVDALLAATALHHGLTLATRNVTDFEGTGVRLVDPWSA